MIVNLYKTRSKKLRELGFKNYDAYLASPHWQQRRVEFEQSHPRRCRYCGDHGDHLHHRRYVNLGAEQDGDLEWVCAPHHEEITRRGSIQPPTARQKDILRQHGYGEEVLGRMTFGSAYELIGKIGRGEQT